MVDLFQAVVAVFNLSRSLPRMLAQAGEVNVLARRSSPLHVPGPTHPFRSTVEVEPANHFAAILAREIVLAVWPRHAPAVAEVDLVHQPAGANGRMFEAAPWQSIKTRAPCRR
jgi:hypothetical protein